MKRLLLTLACLSLSGCGSIVTSGRLEQSIAPAFTRQYHWQQQLQGRPTTGALDTRARCARGGSGDTGAGSDWSCTIQYFETGPQTPVTLTYDVTVHPDGCWTADNGPVSLGGLNLQTPDGTTVPNPLYAIDACFRVG